MMTNLRAIRFPLLLLCLIALTSCGKSGTDSKRISSDDGGDEILTTYRKQIQEVDQRLDAEKKKNGYRIGIFSLPPQTRYGPDGEKKKASGDEVYVGVTLREPRTKRYLPGSTVSLQLDDRSVTLRETWGSFHHYGANVSGPVDSSELSVSVTPPAYGRHAEMKNRYRNDAEVSFSIRDRTENGQPIFDGPSPEPVPDDVTPESGVAMAIEEAGTLIRTGPYLVGFIVESGEPFWTWSTSGGTLEERIPEENEKHLEIVLLDHATGAPVPHASVSVTFGEKNSSKRVKLFPLLAEFYHYGNNDSVSAPEDLKKNVRIKPPSILSFERDRFTKERITLD